MNCFGHTLGGPARLKMFYEFEGFMAPENTYPESSKPGHYDEARNAQPPAAFSGAPTLFEKVDKGFLVDSDLRPWHVADDRFNGWKGVLVRGVCLLLSSRP